MFPNAGLNLSEFLHASYTTCKTKFFEIGRNWSDDSDRNPALVVTGTMRMVPAKHRVR
jgi:hypothetical protein